MGNIVTDRHAVSLINFKKTHLKQIKTREGEHPSLPELIRKPDYAEEFEKNGLSRTVVNSNGDVVAIFGVWPDGEIAFSWLYLAQIFENHAIPTTRKIIEALNWLREQGKFSKVVGTVEQDFPLGERWIEFLGFKPVDRFQEVDGKSLRCYERIL